MKFRLACDVVTVVALVVGCAWQPSTRSGAGGSEIVATPAEIVASFASDVSALAPKHPELAGFAAYAAGRPDSLQIVYANGVKPIRTKRAMRPSDIEANGIYIRFAVLLDDQPTSAPVGHITDLPALGFTLYANVVLSQKPSSGLADALRAIISEHRKLLVNLDAAVRR